MAAVSFARPNTIGAGSPSRFSGPLIVDNDAPDGFIMFGGPDLDSDNNTNMAIVRAAAGDWSRQRTAAGAETYNFRIVLTQAIIGRLGVVYDQTTPGGGLTQSKGFKITKFDVIHQVTVAALTSHTVTGFQQTAYSNNVATAVTTVSAVTGTLHTATQANPYVDTITVTTPIFFNTQDALATFEWQAVLQNTGVYSIKGVVAYFSFNLN